MDIKTKNGYYLCIQTCQIYIVIIVNLWAYCLN